MEPLTTTLRLDASIDHRLTEVWQAFADTGARSQWGAPDGEELIYDLDDFRTGGESRSRCGGPGRLQFRGATDYIVIEPEAFAVFTETLWSEGAVLATSLLTWHFEQAPTATKVEITDQVVSFVGEEMIEGHRNGHTIALRQLERFLDRRAAGG